MRHFRFLGSGLLTLALLVGSAIAQTGTVTTLYNFVTPNLDGTWSETTLHQFGIGSDGVGPSAELVSDGLGNFYSVTLEGAQQATAPCIG
jgi:hypothetical protein